MTRRVRGGAAEPDAAVALANGVNSGAFAKGARSGAMAGTPPAADTGAALAEDAEFGATGDADTAEAEARPVAALSDAEILAGMEPANAEADARAGTGPA